MRIGYSVEDSTHRAFLKGLSQRWCPHAELFEGRFRGSTNLSLRREFPKICDEFVARSVDAMVFLRDANDEDWRQAQVNERSAFPAQYLSRAVHGVADRNVECWICADPDWTGRRLGLAPEQFRVQNPKGAFERASGIQRADRKEAEIAELVREAPLHKWLGRPSFEDFYEQLRARSQQLGCTIENLRDRAAH